MHIYIYKTYSYGFVKLISPAVSVCIPLHDFIKRTLPFVDLPIYVFVKLHLLAVDIYVSFEDALIRPYKTLIASR